MGLCQATFETADVLKFYIIFQIRSSSDASNFDKYPNEDDLPPDEISGWDIEF